MKISAIEKVSKLQEEKDINCFQGALGPGASTGSLKYSNKLHVSSINNLQYSLQLVTLTHGQYRFMTLLTYTQERQSTTMVQACNNQEKQHNDNTAKQVAFSRWNFRKTRPMCHSLFQIPANATINFWQSITVTPVTLTAQVSHNILYV